jgi:hypothetical protein
VFRYPRPRSVGTRTRESSESSCVSRTHERCTCRVRIHARRVQRVRRSVRSQRNRASLHCSTRVRAGWILSADGLRDEPCTRRPWLRF